jgi:hypothetical protein
MKITLFLCTIFLLGAVGSGARSQSLSGVRIGEDIGVTSRLGAAPSAQKHIGPFTLSKWILEDGNELSITSSTASGKIVYIETDWGGKQIGTASDFSLFYYGKTTLAEIRSQFGNNGFSFNGGAPQSGPNNSIINMNSYEIANTDGVIVTFVTKLDAKDVKELAKRGPEFSSHLSRLVTIILGDAKYLRTIWGATLVFDPDYERIVWK